MFKSKLLAVQLVHHAELYPKIQAVLVKDSAIYRITMLTLDPLGFEIVRNDKMVASCWYPEADGRVWPRGDIGALFCLCADKH